jgi:hypothetical protein
MSFTSSGPRSGLSSARSYTSASGTSSGVTLSSVTSGSSVAASSFVSEQKSLGKKISLALPSGLPVYDAGIRQPGDVFFHVDGDVAGHTNMTATDTTAKVDSVDPDGVRKVPIDRDRHTALVFRFSDPAVAQSAALVAEDWVGRVNYSDAAKGFGVTFRALGAVFGSCKFGTGAEARLLKYRSRAHMTPKNVICSEMCVLAFQLSMPETHPGFIKLDAKHTLPSDLMKYFMGSGRTHWTLVARRG